MDGERAEIGSSGVRVPVESWDDNLKSVKADYQDASLLNEKLLIIRTRLLSIYNVMFASGDTFDVHDVRWEYLVKYKSFKVTLMEAFDEFLAANRKDPDLAKSTIVKRKNIRDKLLTYLIFRKQPHMKIEKYDIWELERMKEWLKVTKKHKESHVVKIMATVKQVIIWSKVHGYCKDNPLAGVKIKREKINDPVYLTSQQVTVLKTHQYSHPTMQAVADTFFVYCRTGFHYQDLKDVARNADVSFHKDSEGMDWIYHERIKTGIIAKVPEFMYQEVLPIVAKYGGWKKLKFHCNTKMNTWLKLIAAELNIMYPAINIPPFISVKHGRTSFSNWIMNEKGFSKEATIVMLGLKTDGSLDHYVRLNEKRVKLEMRQLGQDKKSPENY